MVITRHGCMLRLPQHKTPTNGRRSVGRKLSSTSKLRLLKMEESYGITPRALPHKGIMRFGIEVVSQNGHDLLRDRHDP